MCLRVAEVDQYTIAHVLSDKTAEFAYDFSHPAMITANHLAHIFRIKPRRECRRAD